MKSSHLNIQKCHKTNFEFIKKKVSGVLPNGSTDIDYVTETLITGKKRVREGDYALFYSSTDDQNVYLKRVNNKWKIDKTVDDKINSTNKKNDCDLKLDCVSVNDDCVPKDINKTKLRKSIVQKLISEFDNQYEKSKEQLASYVTSKYAKDLYFLEKLVKYRSSEVLKYDTYQFKLGLTVESYDEIIKSPFRDTLKTIMAKENLTPNIQICCILFQTSQKSIHHKKQMMIHSVLLIGDTVLKQRNRLFLYFYTI